MLILSLSLDRRVLIIDFNIHDGKEKEYIFDDDHKVLYITFYHCDDGERSPQLINANGTTVNIPWNKYKVDENDYIATFQRIIMPIAYELNPELVIVSVGFDAVVCDSIDYYHVTPEAYGYFIHWLSSLANGKIILCFERGYNMDSISRTMIMCTKSLLGDRLPMLSAGKKGLNPTCIEAIQNVCSTYQKHWKSLRFNKKLPSFNVFDTVSKM